VLASELVWTQRLQEKSFAAAEDRTPIVQSVVRHFTGFTFPFEKVISKKMSRLCLYLFKADGMKTLVRAG
jgi:hypothetical protein